MPKPKRYTPPFRELNRHGLIQELNAAVKPSMVPQPAAKPPVEYSPSSMTEDDASQLYIPTLPKYLNLIWLIPVLVFFVLAFSFYLIFIK